MWKVSGLESSPFEALTMRPCDIRTRTAARAVLAVVSDHKMDRGKGEVRILPLRTVSTILEGGHWNLILKVTAVLCYKPFSKLEYMTLVWKIFSFFSPSRIMLPAMYE